MRLRDPAVVAVMAGASVVLSPEAASTVTGEPSQVVATSEGWSVQPIFTVGESIGDFTPPGRLDGIGMVAPVDDATIRAYINHELSANDGYGYQLANGVELTGARVTQYDIDKATLSVKEAGLAYDAIYDRDATLVEDRGRLIHVVDEEGTFGFGLARLCSARGVHAGEHDFVDAINLQGEEIEDGSQYALDIASRELWAVPAMGRASWENTTPLDNGSPDSVALLISDDFLPAPLYLYVGQKDAVGDGSFLDRNGLAQGQLYFLALEGVATPEEFKGTGSIASGAWMPIDVYADDGSQRAAPELRAEAFERGGFRFARPEDLHENAADPTQAALAENGGSELFPSAHWGTTYIIATSFDGGGSPLGSELRIVYDGDDAGAGRFDHPDLGLRNPDNLTWASDGHIYIQEDRPAHVDTFGDVSGEEASIWRLDPDSGELARIAKVDRTAIPAGQLDREPGDLGSWETSGILDVSHLFDGAGVTLMADVMAHSLGGPRIDDAGLVEGGQLVLLTKAAM